MKTTTQQRGFHKKVSAVVAAIVVFALLIGGTFAWYSGIINAENVFTGTKTPPPPTVILHDDFKAPSKDIYAENIGEGTVYVRVKLNEFLALGVNERPEEIADTEWVTHIPGETGGNLDFTKHKAPDAFHDNFEWSWGAGKQKDYIKADGTLTGSVRDMYQDYTPEEIAQLFLDADPDIIGTTTLGDIVNIDWYVMDGFIASYNSYHNLIGADALTDRSDFYGWIYDADGWVYWSQPLHKGDVTSLLLDKVIVDVAALKDTDFCYIIDVIMEAVDLADLQAMWIDGGDSVDLTNLEPHGGVASDDGIKALEFIKTFS